MAWINEISRAIINSDVNSDWDGTAVGLGEKKTAVSRAVVIYKPGHSRPALFL